MHLNLSRRTMSLILLTTNREMIAQPFLWDLIFLMETWIIATLLAMVRLLGNCGFFKRKLNQKIQEAGDLLISFSNKICWIYNYIAKSRKMLSSISKIVDEWRTSKILRTFRGKLSITPQKHPLEYKRDSILYLHNFLLRLFV